MEFIMRLPLMSVEVPLGSKSRQPKELIDTQLFFVGPESMTPATSPFVVERPDRMAYIIFRLRDPSAMDVVRTLETPIGHILQLLSDRMVVAGYPPTERPVGLVATQGVTREHHLFDVPPGHNHRVQRSDEHPSEL